MNKYAISAREKLLEKMSPHSVAILFSSNAPHKTLDQYYAYTPQRNFYYLTHLDRPNMILLLLKGETESKTMLFIEKNTEYLIQWEGARIEKEEASKISGVDILNIHYLDTFKKTFNMIANYARSPLGAPPKMLYLDLYHTSPEQKPVALKQADFIIDNYPELCIKNINEHVAYLRMFKNDWELKHINQAIRHTQKGLERIMQGLNTRKHEYQLQADFLHEITLEGSEGNAFDTIVASGKNATTLHYVENKDVLEQKNLVLLDLGALHQHYAADISRTYPISGKFTDRQKILYEIVLKVNEATIEQVKPGVTWKALNDFAKDLLAKECQKINLIDKLEDIGKYYYHSIGHFLGLDVHDVGHYHMPLEEGMVLTIEPGLYIAEECIGIRIEDNILVTKDGAKNLSAAIIKKTEAIENYIKHTR